MKKANFCRLWANFRRPLADGSFCVSCSAWAVTAIEPLTRVDIYGIVSLTSDNDIFLELHPNTVNVETGYTIFPHRRPLLASCLSATKPSTE
jgi:hypothetical protein